MSAARRMRPVPAEVVMDAVVTRCARGLESRRRRMMMLALTIADRCRDAPQPDGRGACRQNNQQQTPNHRKRCERDVVEVIADRSHRFTELLLLAGVSSLDVTVERASTPTQSSSCRLRSASP